MAGCLHLDKDLWGTRCPVKEQRLLGFFSSFSLSVHERWTRQNKVSTWVLAGITVLNINDACACTPPVSSQFSRDFTKKRQLMWDGRKIGGQTGHRCSCTADEESICSFNVTWRENRCKNSCQETFRSFYLSHTEMRCYNSPTAGHPKITAENVRLQSVRWGQER